jgi:hypothetical protein
MLERGEGVAKRSRERSLSVTEKSVNVQCGSAAWRVNQRLRNQHFEQPHVPQRDVRNEQEASSKSTTCRPFAVEDDDEEIRRKMAS